MKIFLIGFMGSGKSSFGRKLAKSLDYEFYDMDGLVEEQVGMTIREYFQEAGEHAFREKEKSALQTTTFAENSVIATGGGAPCYSDNMDWMNKNGITAYLSIPPKGLVERLAHGRDKRPLIKDFNDEELLNYITNKLSEREEHYNKAKFTIIGTDLTAEQFLRETGIS
ncbi:MAG TPA: shikimate kinase [Sphingobacteriaceae bacterium]|nr:shikimate kinase [Sphingobacteriaceae bacterium]